jgi:hypothetical protein
MKFKTEWWDYKLTKEEREEQNKELLKLVDNAKPF